MALRNPPGSQGSIGLNYRGLWSSAPSPTYKQRDLVRRANVSTPQNGGLFICLANGITSDPLVDTTNWSIFAADGQTGPQGNLATGLDGSSAATGNNPQLMVPDPPVVNSFIATSIRAREATTAGRPGTGTIIFQKIWLPSPATISNVTYVLGATGSANQTDYRVGLYDANGNLLVGSGNNSSIMNANNVIGNFVTAPLSSSYNWPGGTNAYLYAAYLAIGGTQTPAPQFSNSNTSIVNLGQTSATSNQLQSAGQSSLPSTITFGTSTTVNGSALWIGLS